jgi:uncharacterized protein (TIGR03083 family)
MSVDYVSIISDEAARMVEAYERDPSAAVPWSDRWTVGTVARHVAGTHHVVAEIIRGRPDADFGLFADLQTPTKGAPEFVEWFGIGTAHLLEQLQSVPAEEHCWSWFSSGGCVGWWARRMAFEAVVHRWDMDAALGQTFSLAPDTAADGVDEYLDVFVLASRSAVEAPAGPVIGIECSDRTDNWWLDLSAPGDRIVHRDPRTHTLRIRGTAQDLLLFLWGRVPASNPGGVEVLGDLGVMDRWSELIPPM